jgi:AdoMet dependent proline di-methyltransferase
MARTKKKASSGNSKTPPAAVSSNATTTTTASKHFSQQQSISSETIKGMDDKGNFYSCHEDLTRVQALHRTEYYRANNQYWSNGGYGGLTDDEAMIGDTDGVNDAAEGLAFLDRFLLHCKVTALSTSTAATASTGLRQFDHAIDVGAGVGRITKLVLLKRYSQVQLVEGDEGWSKRSRVYLGRKRAARCCFIQQKLDEVTCQDVLRWCDNCPSKKVDLIWIQWTLQYLIDADVVTLLTNLAEGLRPGSGIIIVKENRPYANAREDRFQMDVPGGCGNNGRYDITRPNHHHHLLFQKAGLSIVFAEQGVETNTYVLTVVRGV